jgi:hypothetical protein
MAAYAFETMVTAQAAAADTVIDKGDIDQVILVGVTASAPPPGAILLG